MRSWNYRAEYTVRNVENHPHYQFYSEPYHFFQEEITKHAVTRKPNCLILSTMQNFKITLTIELLSISRHKVQLGPIYLLGMFISGSIFY